MKAKHTLAGALALAMLASTAVSFQVSAADTAVTLKGAKVEAEAGGEFSVDVSGRHSVYEGKRHGLRSDL